MHPANTGLSVMAAATSLSAFRYSATRPASNDGTSSVSAESDSPSNGLTTAGTSSSGNATSAPNASASTVKSIIAVEAEAGNTSFSLQMASECTCPSVTASLTVLPQSSIPGWVMIGMACTVPLAIYLQSIDSIQPSFSFFTFITSLQFTITAAVCLFVHPLAYSYHTAD